MAKEIERKFLIDADHPEVKKIFEGWYKEIEQAYLKSDETGIVRVRATMTDKGLYQATSGKLTVKGPTKGISRNEYEFEVPYERVREILDDPDLDLKALKKKRYEHSLRGGLIAEIDVFEQLDLIVAEVELPSEAAEFEAPEWFIKDVSDDPSYYNNEILKRIL